MTNGKRWWKRILVGSLLAMTTSLAATNLAAQENSRKLVFGPTPSYPELARKVHLAGTVKVQVVIGPEGKIKEVKVIGGHPLLVDAVQDTLKSWKYAPGSSETTTTLQFNFHE